MQRGERRVLVCCGTREPFVVRARGGFGCFFLLSIAAFREDRVLIDHNDRKDDLSRSLSGLLDDYSNNV